MSNLVAKVEALLLQESLDTLCGASVIYLTIEDNTLPPYNDVQSRRKVTPDLKSMQKMAKIY